ncbi:DUF934 domain-containing protein [Roseovarius sp. LXJ103]|uniref:DUF934 domain-containing protein n=1 Tax=Roseovarius carneus TaxID=2853164 RepID=UPI000D612609|nr:DUF934 domain-containing protein [Roseovarius carneus]MBZ8119333.1 DUF934 domain-containing protein [Roseovarius carneus]PWE35057.1 oxidoreductase [Pelagicola sp. LXJ1103]
MSILVTDQGFAPDDWTTPIAALNDAHDGIGIDLPSSADPLELAGRLPEVPLIRVDFPSFADGRGFTIARQLRLMGYQGRLRARGHVIADQYSMARRAGFDEVEISDDLAARQPEDQWMARADWRSHDYQTRLRG